jgi:hypothetical protein
MTSGWLLLQQRGVSATASGMRLSATAGLQLLVCNCWSALQMPALLSWWRVLMFS